MSEWIEINLPYSSLTEEHRATLSGSLFCRGANLSGLVFKLSE